MQTRAARAARVFGEAVLTKGGWWSATVRSAAERFRR
jgi:hypothetical protein